MEERERKYLIKALYDIAWKLAEFESTPQLKKLSKKEYNDILTKKTTGTVTGLINITPHELHTIIREIMLTDKRQSIQG